MSLRSRLVQFTTALLRRHRGGFKKLVFFVLGCVVFVAVIFFAYRAVVNSNWYKDYRTIHIKYKKDNNLGTKEGGVAYRRIDGKEIKIDASLSEEEKSKLTNPPLVAVMVDNQVDARPPSGLSFAPIVYEAPAEGNITRFMALYAFLELPEKVGPVRSARPYYLDYLIEWGSPLYLHVGGSPDALARLISPAYNDFNEYYHGQNFVRDSARSAPHNIYTSKDLLKDLIAPVEDTWLKTADYFPITFATSTENSFFASNAQGTTDAKKVSITFLNSGHLVNWVWNANEKNYERMQAGNIHRDSSGEPIVADNVIIQQVKTKVLDDIGRLKIDTTGSGAAWIISNGKKIEGVWKKSTTVARTQFFTKNNQLIVMPPGTTWFEIVPTEIFSSIQF